MRSQARSLASCLVGEGSSVVMSCGVCHRLSLDPTLLWLWRRPVAAAPIGPLAWEPPGAALKSKNKKQKQEQSRRADRYEKINKWGELLIRCLGSLEMGVQVPALREGR